jgi:hypothetical protein
VFCKANSTVLLKNLDWKQFCYTSVPVEAAVPMKVGKINIIRISVTGTFIVRVAVLSIIDLTRSGSGNFEQIGNGSAFKITVRKEFDIFLYEVPKCTV